MKAVKRETTYDFIIRHPRKAAAKMADLEAENEALARKLKEFQKLYWASLEVVAKLQKAILTWWHGAPTDAGSEQQLCDVAAELENTD